MIMMIRNQFSLNQTTEPALALRKRKGLFVSLDAANDHADASSDTGGDGIGQLVLNVDFSPPKLAASDYASAAPVPAATTAAAITNSGSMAADCPASGPTLARNNYFNASRATYVSSLILGTSNSSVDRQRGHLIELSLCIKQRQSAPSPIMPLQQQQQAPSARQDDNDKSGAELNFCPAAAVDHQSTLASGGKSNNNCDTSATVRDACRPERLDCGLDSERAQEAARQKKRRLVYERIDKFSLNIGHNYYLGNDSATLPATNYKLPFKSASFDACFCFNLLNIHVTSFKLLNSIDHHNGEQQQFDSDGPTKRKNNYVADRNNKRPDSDISNDNMDSRLELEQNWLLMERLTSELRLNLLNELSRVVRAKGQIMICVFAYECTESGGPCEADERARQQQQQEVPNNQEAGAGLAEKMTMEKKSAARQQTSPSSRQQQQDDEPAEAQQRRRGRQDNEQAVERWVEEEDGREVKEAKNEQHLDSCCPRCRLEIIEKQRQQQQQKQLKQPHEPINPSCRSRRRQSDTTGSGDQRRSSRSAAQRQANNPFNDTCDTSGASQSQPAEDQPVNGANLPETPFEATTTLLRAAMRKGSTISDDLSQSIQSFQAHRDSISQVAKRFGRKLSSTILDRLVFQQSTATQSFNDNRVGENKVTTATCDIKIDQSSLANNTAECCPEDNEQRKEFAIKQTTDVLSMFQDDEFAKRHRQSIAVQTFFTKSIEMNADEEEEAEAEMNRCLQQQQQQAMSAENDNDLDNYNDDDRDSISRSEDDYAFDQLMSNDSTTSGWTAPTTSANQSADLATTTTSSGNQPINNNNNTSSSLIEAECRPSATRNRLDSGSRKRRSSESTSAINEAARSQRAARQRSDKRAASAAERQHPAARKQTNSKDYELASGSPNKQQILFERPFGVGDNPDSGNNNNNLVGESDRVSSSARDELESLDRINSDLSSFTLITSGSGNGACNGTSSSTNNNRDNVTGQGRQLAASFGNYRANKNFRTHFQQSLLLSSAGVSRTINYDSVDVNGRKMIQIKKSLTNNEQQKADLADARMQHHYHNQRRAFSENEAYDDDSLNDEINDLIGNCNFMSHKNKIAYKGLLPANLIELNPAQITTAINLGARQVKSAEPIHYITSSSQILNNQSTTTTTTTSSSDKPPRNVRHQQGDNQRLPSSAGYFNELNAPLGPNQTSNSGTSAASSNPNNTTADNHHSTSNLLDKRTSLQNVNAAYVPFDGQQQAQQMHQQQTTSHEHLAAHAKSVMNQAKYQQHQWCHSNTFSSSLNSDISTGGGGGGAPGGAGNNNPHAKDTTTEKDSSRRTSTLSGISSIYQQEISLGLATPYSVSSSTAGYGGLTSNPGGTSTPANSSLANNALNNSNMGSIPELASVDQMAAFNHQSRGLAKQTLSDARGFLSDSIQSDKDLFGGEQENNSGHNKEAPQQQPQRPDNDGSADINDAPEAQAPSDLSEFGGGGGGGGPALNLQKVASSLKSQLRERFSTMRSLNYGSLMGHLTSSGASQTGATTTTTTATNCANNNNSNTIHEEQAAQEVIDANDQTTTDQTDLNSSPAINGNQDQVFDAAAPTTNSRLPYQQALRKDFYPSSPLSFSQRTSTNKTETPTPATLKSFFRSTSSAAFNAFASSFQSSANLTANSSDVFEPASSQQQLDSTAETNANLTNCNSPMASLSTAATSGTGAGPKSPISPISSAALTSNKFFARIRDKFTTLSPSSSTSMQQQQASNPPPRPNSCSVSTSTATTATTVVGKKQILGQQPRSGNVEQQRLSKLITSFERNEEAPGGGFGQPRRDQVASVSKAARDTATAAEILVATRDADDTSVSMNESTFESEAFTSTTSSSAPGAQRSADPSANLDANSSGNPRKLLLPANFETSDEDHHYEQIVSSRRPSFQRQLDEQVNQVYRMAVERKLQNSPIAPPPCCDFFQQDLQQPGAKSPVDLKTTSAAAISQLTACQSPQGATQSSIYLPQQAYLYQSATSASSGCFAPVASVPQRPLGQHPPQYIQDVYQQRPSWLDSSQQSIDSSSSARSLRSCWFSMPELYAMNQGDSSSATQSPSGLYVPPNLAAAAGKQSPLAVPSVDQLLNALSTDPVVGLPIAAATPATTTAVEWPAKQLYKQVTSDQGQNWSLSDLNLTSDDIATPAALPVTLNQQNKATTQSSPRLAQQNQADELIRLDQMEKLIKCATLDDSICTSMKSNSSPSSANKMNDSRPTSQNSTISNTSCALSDYQNTNDQQGSQNVSPEKQTSSITPQPTIPQCTITSEVGGAGEMDKEKDSVNTNDELLKQPAMPKQRAMSLVYQPETSQQQQLLPTTSPYQVGSLSPLPANFNTPRRRSAMGCLLPNSEIAPAATTLDLRLTGRNRNRVKLTDLHPITFINDKEFLNSMQSLRKADNNKLQAIFNSPVGRRLSVNAEMAQNSPFNQTKSGIKIGLTGYVYIDPQKQVRGSAGLLNNLNQVRRPSLAPNFWRSPQTNPCSSAGTLNDENRSNQNSDFFLAPAQSRPRAASYTPNVLLPEQFMTSSGSNQSSKSPELPVSKPAEQATVIKPAPLKTTVIKSRPIANYNFERRRATMGMLERLSESSIEIVDQSGNIGADCTHSGSLQQERNHDQGRPLNAEHGQLSQPSIRHPKRKSISCLLKIGENEELKGTGTVAEVPVAAANGRQQHQCSEASDGDSSDSSETSEANNSSSGANGNDSTDSSGSSSDDGDIDKLVLQYSSGANDALIDAVGTKGATAGAHQPQRASASNQLRQRFNSTGSKTFDSVGRHQFRPPGSDRIVKNDMILKQLLQATNVATLAISVSASNNDHQHHYKLPTTTTTQANTQAFLQHNSIVACKIPKEMRRFSAINLYQRDEDLFVANSMKRPPSSQLQALNTLPLLAGTLPVLSKSQAATANNNNSSCNNQSTVGASSANSANMLPILPNSRTNVKSIISGSSGLNALSSQTGDQQGRCAPIGFGRIGSVKATSVAEVDVEEQLNRLRQQEKRSIQAFNSPCPATSNIFNNPGSILNQSLSSSSDSNSSSTSSINSSSSSSSEWNGPIPDSSHCTDDDSINPNDDTIGEVTVPSKPTIPAILQPPRELLATKQPEVVETEASRNNASAIDSMDSISRSKISPPRSPTTIINSLTLNLNTASGQNSATMINQTSCQPQAPISPLTTSSLLSSNPASAVRALEASGGSSLLLGSYNSGSKSCEPPSNFKQLDTIIEGRGLLLGAEQQANPSYANRLRRLSGNHSRRSSLVNNQLANGRTEQQQTSGETQDGFCSCDLNQPSRKQAKLQADLRRKQAGEVQRKATSEASTATTIGASSKFVLDTMKSLARRTLNNFSSSISGSGGSLAATSPSADDLGKPSELVNNPLKSSSVAPPMLIKQTSMASMNVIRSRQQRSSSMIVQSSTKWNDSQAVTSTGAPLMQPTLPSQLLREKVKANKQRQDDLKNRKRTRTTSKHFDLDYEDDLDEGLSDEEEEDFSSTTESADEDSSLMSLDDAENYHTKNKENKMKHGRSLESSSSSSSTTISDDDGDSLRDRGKRDHDEVEDEEEEIFEDDEEEVEDEESPKICYKCNKPIQMEYLEEEDKEEEEDDEEEEYLSDEELDQDNIADPTLKQSSRSPRVQSGGGTAGASSSNRTEDGCQDPQNVQTFAGHHEATSSSGPAANQRASGRRRGAAARRSASMNSADPAADANLSMQTSSTGFHINRRKNKWQIQRNLAPKLKRQRSFSANYAPEVPNPIMPPPRRFSAAPTLTCPHRNKHSSSHSSSSLHHTYSIDSSESMITVIPAKGCQEERTSRGSLSCNSGQGGLSDLSGSFCALPRSPMSPRSPSRCSPNLLTPITPGEQSSAPEPPHSPGATTTSCSSAITTSNLNTVIQNQQQQQQQVNNQTNSIATTTTETTRQGTSGTSGNKIQVQSSTSNGSCYNLTLPTNSISDLNIDEMADNSSLAVENGTSCNESSRNEMLDLDDLQQQSDMDAADLEANRDAFGLDNYENDESFPGENFPDDGQPFDLDAPIIRETINEFCARHSREELEFLIGQIGYLQIRDCYFSKKSSTLCMVIKVQEFD